MLRFLHILLILELQEIVLVVVESENIILDLIFRLRWVDWNECFNWVVYCGETFGISSYFTIPDLLVDCWIEDHSFVLLFEFLSV